MDNVILMEDTGFRFKSASAFLENRLRYRILFKIADTFFLF